MLRVKALQGLVLVLICLSNWAEPVAPSGAIGHLRLEGGTLDSGGGTGAVGSYVLNATIGQWEAGSLSTEAGGNRFELRGGFWPARCEAGECAVVSTFAVSSSDEGWTYPVVGTLAQQLEILNGGPPSFDSDTWSFIDSEPPGIRSAPPTDLANAFRCSCAGIDNPDFGADCNAILVDDPTMEPYLSSTTVLPFVDVVTHDNCGSAFYRFTFNMPEEFFEASIAGTANVDDQGVVFLNGHPISGLMSIPGFTGCPAGDVCYGSETCASCDRRTDGASCMACEPLPDCGPLGVCYRAQDWSFTNEEVNPVDESGRRILTWPSADPFGTTDPALFRPGENELVFAVAGDASWYEPTGLQFEAFVFSDPDCNLNGHGDIRDIREGTSLDHNQNGIPDECEGPDCDRNGIPDQVELRAGLAEDDNVNALPDGCESKVRSCSDDGKNGLIATYFDGPNFDGPNFNGPSVARIDPDINWTWADRAPFPTFSPDSFSVRWSGVLLSESAGFYDFYASVDGGVVLRINGVNVINKPNNRAQAEFAGRIDLEEEVEYFLEVDYTSSSENANVRLSWKPDGRPEEIVPEDQLFIGLDCNGNGTSDSLDIARGGSIDCNLNGRPDDCDVEGANPVSEGCVLAPDQSGADCDHNFFPDECEADEQSGLVGTYFNGTDFEPTDPPDPIDPTTDPPLKRKRARVDATIDFEFLDPPWDEMGEHGIAARWEGRILTTANSGSYAFFLEGENGLRLSVNGQRLINDWPGLGERREVKGAIVLEGNREYTVRIEYNDTEGPAPISFRWQPPGEPSAEVVPPSNLRTGGDCNGNGVPDRCDLDSDLGGTSQDCDFSLRPDECETDCNGNGLEDSCDVASGFSSDCNLNGAPDECDAVDDLVATDCNTNDILDECEIDSLLVEDCDNNGRPDSCDTVVTDGLVATYFDDAAFQSMPRGRVEHGIDYTAADNVPPWFGFDPTNYSIRWLGRLRNLVAGEYEFTAHVDGEVELWIDGARIIHGSANGDPGDFSATIPLEADREYRLEMKYVHRFGDAVATLRWRTPDGRDELVPVANLVSGGDCDANGVPDTCEIDADPNLDTNGDGLLDRCESVDCNQNGTADFRDISSGVSEDCNGNSIPDECESDLLQVDGFHVGSPRSSETIGGTAIAFTGSGFRTGMSVVFTNGFYRQRAAGDTVVASLGGTLLEVEAPVFPPGCECGPGEPIRVDVEFDNGCGMKRLNEAGSQFEYTPTRNFIAEGDDVQAAIDAAEPGTCLVLQTPGRHAGPVTVSGEQTFFTLTSAEPGSPGQTELDGGYTPDTPAFGPTLTIDGSDDTVCISGLNIRLGDGGVEIQNGATAILYGCRIDNNVAENLDRAGGVTIVGRSRPLVFGNTIAVNQSKGEAGGLRISHSSGTIVQNSIRGNKAWYREDGKISGEQGAAVYLDGTDEDLIVAENAIEQNQAAGTHITGCPISGSEFDPEFDGGGVYWTGESESPGKGLLLRNTILENTSYFGRGTGLHIDQFAEPTIANNVISLNRGLHEKSVGGGVLVEEFNRKPFRFCGNQVDRNEAHAGGGVVILRKDAVHAFENLIYCNRAEFRWCDTDFDPPRSFAPGVLVRDASPTIKRNTIYGNTGGGPTLEQGGGLHGEDLSTGFPIFWDNILSMNDDWEVYSNLSLEGLAEVPIDWNIGFDSTDPGHIFSPTTAAGSNSLVADPQLVLPSCESEQPRAAFAVSESSPAVCSASNGCYRGAVQGDCPDCEREQCVPVRADDCDGNGIPDYADILLGSRSDGNLNGVPDRCDLDSDDNGSVGIEDFQWFSGCLMGPNGDVAPGCEPADVARNGKIDLGDFAVFQNAFIGNEGTH